MNNSPWIAQLNRQRPVSKIIENTSADTVIVGGGIAGISTAYYCLKHTDKKITLVEAGKVAHGATGHNAGQLVSYFERPFSNLVKQYGLRLAADGQKSIESAWSLLDGILSDTQLATPCYQFTGQAGIKDLKELLIHLKNNSFRQKAGLSVPLITVAQEWTGVEKIPKKYNALFVYAPQASVLEMLETNDSRYIAALPERKGVMNSALFCEELTGYLIQKYPDRFTLSEDTLVQELILDKNKALLKTGQVDIYANTVVLCTNGFEKIKITNRDGQDIDARFHHLVRGSVGYMAGYLDKAGLAPTSISYLPEHTSSGDSFTQEPYFYLTRRPFESNNQLSSLICVGGPESLMDDTNNYHQEHPYPQEAQDDIDQFLHATYRHAPNKKIEYTYKWHGLMGYTPNGVRCIGPEPRNKILHYNLGCNGVGLLHSIYGGFKISQFLAGKKLEPSIFDPAKQF